LERKVTAAQCVNKPELVCGEISLCRITTLARREPIDAVVLASSHEGLAVINHHRQVGTATNDDDVST
jgi:hypothetical protein